MILGIYWKAYMIPRNSGLRIPKGMIPTRRAHMIQSLIPKSRNRSLEDLASTFPYLTSMAPLMGNLAKTSF